MDSGDSPGTLGLCVDSAGCRDPGALRGLCRDAGGSAGISGDRNGAVVFALDAEYRERSIASSEAELEQEKYDPAGKTAEDVADTISDTCKGLCQALCQSLLY